MNIRSAHNPRTRLTVCQCQCGYEHCRYYWVNGFGCYNQGTGFTAEEADELIVALVKAYPDRYEDGRPSSATT